MIYKYSILNGAKYFSSSVLQIYLVFQLFISHFLTKKGKIYSWKSKGMSEESIIPPYPTEESFYPEVIRLSGGKYELKFKGMCLKQNSVSFLHKNIVNLCINYRLYAWSKDLNTDFTLGNCLFGTVKLTRNADPDKYKYRGNFRGQMEA